MTGPTREPHFFSIYHNNPLAPDRMAFLGKTPYHMRFFCYLRMAIKANLGKGLREQFLLLCLMGVMTERTHAC